MITVTGADPEFLATSKTKVRQFLDQSAWCCESKQARTTKQPETKQHKQQSNKHNTTGKCNTNNRQSMQARQATGNQATQTSPQPAWDHFFRQKLLSLLSRFSKDFLSRIFLLKWISLSHPPKKLKL
jgi:hypothetical protein